MISEKIHRYIFIETRAKYHIAIILALVLMAVAELVTMALINGKIREGEEHKALIVRIPEMESVLYPKASRPTLITKEIVEPIKIGNTMYVLKGTQELNGQLSALINDDVYQVGDIIQGYRITKINTDSVLFKNDATNDMKILRMGN